MKLLTFVFSSGVVTNHPQLLSVPAVHEPEAGASVVVTEIASSVERRKEKGANCGLIWFGLV